MSVSQLADMLQDSIADLARDLLGEPHRQLSSAQTLRFRREIGVEMTSHQFRHLATVTWLDANPGAYEGARRLLGHSEASHTLNLYTGLEARTALQAYGRVLTEKRGRGR